MGQVVHGSATEPALGLDPGDRGGPSSGTAWSRDLRTLSKRYGINQKTVAKLKKRTSVADLPPP